MNRPLSRGLDHISDDQSNQRKFVHWSQKLSIDMASSPPDDPDLRDPQI